MAISQRGQVILAYLLSRPDTRARREDLANLLWEERGEDQARASLRQELSLLRKALPDGTLITDRASIGLDAGMITLDPAAPGAEFLAGLTLRGDGLHHWLRDTRAADTATRIAAHLDTGAASLANGDPDRARDAASAALTLDPYDETALRLLMQADAAMGNTAAALGTFARFAATLKDDLQTEPSTETTTLADALRSGDAPNPAPDKPAPDTPARTKPALAVLAFDDLTGAAHDMFADGVVEEITGALSRVADFHVIARQSSFALRGQGLNIPQTAMQLGADYIVEGSIRRAGDRVRIAVELSRAEDAHVLWSQRFDDRLDDLFDLQDRIATLVAGQISPSLRIAEIARATTTPPENRSAYELTLTAMPHFWAHQKHENRIAIDLLDTALERDPNYGYARAIKAWALSQQPSYMWSHDPKADRALALSAIEAAAKTVGDHAPSLVAIAAALTISSPDLDHARSYADRALAIDPNNAWGWMRLAFIEMYGGNVTPAITLFEKAEQLSPLDPFRFNFLLGRSISLRELGDHDQSVALIRQAMRLNPGMTWAYRMLAGHLLLSGRTQEAAEATDAFRRHYPHVTLQYLRDCWPPSVVARQPYYMEAFRKAGLPEE